MRTVRLYGELGKRFGRMHRFAVKSPAEAIRALRANFKGFDRYMVESESRGIGFKVQNGELTLEHADQVRDPASGEIKIIPMVIGASAGIRILIGAALIAASFFVPPLAFAGVTLSGTLFAVGLSLSLGGVAQMLSPTPSSETNERPENDPSYLFNGPVNTTAQGQPVPICYGHLIVGGAVVSAGISIEQLKTGTTTKIVMAETSIDLYVSHFTPGVVMTAGTYKSYNPVWWSDPSLTVPATPPAEIKTMYYDTQVGAFADKYTFVYFVRSEVEV